MPIIYVTIAYSPAIIIVMINFSKIVVTIVYLPAIVAVTVIVYLLETTVAKVYLPAIAIAIFVYLK